MFEGFYKDFGKDFERIWQDLGRNFGAILGRSLQRSWKDLCRSLPRPLGMDWEGSSLVGMPWACFCLEFGNNLRLAGKVAPAPWNGLGRALSR